MYRLVRTPRARHDPPALDAAQRAVVEHPGGPLLVLAGPGTGKTTTLVESVVDRIEHRGITPDAILVLTFSRKAAADLRARIAARLGRATVTPMVMTFHAFCYSLVRRFADRVGLGLDSFGPPLRLLTGPEQDFRVRETLLGSLETRRVDWPDSLARAFPTRAFATEIRAVLAKARQLGMDPDGRRRGGRSGRSARVGRGGGVLRRVPRRARCRGRAGLRRARTPLPHPARRPGCGRHTAPRDRRGVRRRVPRHRPGPGPAAPGHRRRRTQCGGGG